MVDPIICAALIAAGAPMVQGAIHGINNLNQDQRGNFTKSLSSKKFHSLGNVHAVIVTCQENTHNGVRIQDGIMCGLAYYEVIVFYGPGFYENHGDGGYCNHALYGRVKKVTSNRWEIR
ncbi:hypothetical protein BDC45DRAFT_524798 [Circinella umbellata]|nr:hypothetical protein BDC45DRAFT_524798 [Circinella umbellata]